MSYLPVSLNMEESKAFTVKQTQAGDDSGYSCTSTQSKYSIKSCHSQSASSGYSCFEERRSSTLKTTENRKMSTSNSKSPELPNQTIDVSGSESTANPESFSNKSSKSEQINLTVFEPQMDQLFNIDVSELNQTPSTSKLKIDESNDLNDNDTKEGDGRNNLAFLQLATLCKSYHNYLNTKNLISNPNDESTISASILKELNEQEVQLKEIIESDKIHDDSFGFVVSMNDGLIINTSNNIHKSMGYPKDMGQGRSFIDFIHTKDRMSFINYVTSVLINPYKISRRDGMSTMTFLKAKNTDGFYCNMRRYRGLNTGYSIYKNKDYYQVCKLTITFKDVSYASTSPCLAQMNKIPQSQLHLIVKAQIIQSAYTYPEEKIETPVSFVTKHNASFEWCYVDHLIISYLGYLPQNFIGKSIFDYYNIEDLPTIKEIHENMTKPRSVPYKGNPYRFKCQNGDFALIQTEWSNFVNPWSERVEFVIGRHKVIQGPMNPDVITLVDDVTTPETKKIEDNKNANEIYNDIKKVLNKNIYESDISNQTNQTLDLSTNVKKQRSKKCKDLALYMNNCFEKDSSIQVPLEVKVQPETCGSFSNHDSVILGEISPHHNYESKSSSGTPPSYTQLNYNDNILRFFKSNLQSNSSEDLNDQNYPKEITARKLTPFDIDMDRIQQDTISLLQSVTPSSSSVINQMSTSCSEQNSMQNSQQPLTQKMLLRHNKKMEDDFVNQHKNNTKRIKSSVKQKQNLPDGNADIPDITNHGIKRNISSEHENKSSKVTKRKHFADPTDVIKGTQENEEIIATPTVARATQIWLPSKITRDSQTMVDLPRSPPVLPSQTLSYNVPLSNNVMPLKQNEYENAFTVMDPHEHNQESLSSQMQLLTVPLYASIPVMNHIPQSPPVLQPCLHYYNQLLLQQPYQNIQFKTKMNPQNDVSVPTLPNTFHQRTKLSQVNQDEVITSSDSEYSSFYSSILRYKTDSSDREECSWPLDNKMNCPHEFIKNQPFKMENVIMTPDIIYRYQMEHGDINEVLRKDLSTLNTFTQPLLVNEQLKQLCVELNVNGTSKTSYYEDGSSSSGGDECLISIGNNKKKNINFSRMAMIYEENAPLPPPTSSPRLIINHGLRYLRDNFACTGIQGRPDGSDRCIALLPQIHH